MQAILTKEEIAKLAMTIRAKARAVVRVEIANHVELVQTLVAKLMLMAKTNSSASI